MRQSFVQILLTRDVQSYRLDLGFACIKTVCEISNATEILVPDIDRQRSETRARHTEQVARRVSQKTLDYLRSCAAHAD